MTVSASLAQWLLESGLLPCASLPSDALGPEEGSCALLTEVPSREAMLDGSGTCRARFSLLLRLPAQTDPERDAARSLLEALARWVRRQDALGDLPALDGSRACLSARAAAGGSPRSATDACAVYQLPIDLTWWEV